VSDVTGPSRVVVRLLAALTVLELGSLAVLLVNLFGAHLRPITQLIGPIHGAVYTVVVVVVVFAPGFRPWERLLGCLPVIGGAIALVRAARRR
jgi:hypothetical protein